MTVPSEVETLSYASGKSRRRKRFWRRQFAPAVTIPQILFDVFFGIAMPIICLWLDPVVFVGPPGDLSLAACKLPCYYMIGAEIILLTLWLLLGRHMLASAALVAGGLLAGGVFALLVGTLMLPLSLLGLLLLIGVLGFTPFLTGFVYLRNGIRAAQQAGTFVGRPAVHTLAVMGLLIIPVFPGLAGWGVLSFTDRCLSRLVSGDDVSHREAEQTLQRFWWLVDEQQVIRAYMRDQDPQRRGILAETYNEITGRDLDLEASLQFD